MKPSVPRAATNSPPCLPIRRDTGMDMAAQDSNDLKLRLERSGSVYRVQGSDGTTLASPAVGTLQELLHPSVAKNGDWTTEDAESLSRQLREIIFQHGTPGSLIPSTREAPSPGATPRLLLDLEGVEELENLPWELLARPEAQGGVCLVRSVLSPGRPPARLQPEPFCVLTIIASPADMPPFDFDWKLGGTASSVERLEEPSEACLHRTISAQPFQVLHFVGYGRSNAEARCGILFLEGQDRHSRGITAEYFASILCQRQQAMLSLGNPRSWKQRRGAQSICGDGAHSRPQGYRFGDRDAAPVERPGDDDVSSGARWCARRRQLDRAEHGECAASLVAALHGCGMGCSDALLLVGGRRHDSNSSTFPP